MDCSGINLFKDQKTYKVWHFWRFYSLIAVVLSFICYSCHSDPNKANKESYFNDIFPEYKFPPRHIKNGLNAKEIIKNEKAELQKQTGSIIQYKIKLSKSDSLYIYYYLENGMYNEMKIKGYINNQYKLNKTINEIKNYLTFYIGNQKKIEQYETWIYYENNQPKTEASLIIKQKTEKEQEFILSIAFRH
jgi:hypothetical protein